MRGVHGKKIHFLSMNIKKSLIFVFLLLLSAMSTPARAVDFIDGDELFEVIDDADFDKPIVIEFWANWCPGSRVVAPRFGEVAREFGKRAYFFKVDIDEYPEVVSYFNLNMLPCVLAIYIGTNDDGQPQVYWTGARGEPYLKTGHIRDIVNEALASHN